MKINRLFVIAGLLILIACNSLAFSMENAPADTVLNYFQACENGDVNTIRSLIVDRFYQRRRVLLEDNEEYPEFLRSYYSGMRIEIIATEVEGENGNAAVRFEQTFPNGNIIDATLILKKNTDSIWKISDEILPE